MHDLPILIDDMKFDTKLVEKDSSAQVSSMLIDVVRLSLMDE